MKTKLQETSKI